MPSKRTLTNWLIRTSATEATRRLIAAHRDEYDRLRAEERARLNAVTGYQDGRYGPDATARGQANATRTNHHRWGTPT